MDQKYWVPALERADLILRAISRTPGAHKMTDLCEETGINKSSMFSLLRTMETLQWVAKDAGERYALGAGVSYYNTVYNESLKQNTNLVERFLAESVQSVRAVGETFQLSVLDRNEIIYLAKQEGQSLVRLESSPGMRFPAHATAMGKMMLALLPEEELERRYPGKSLSAVTSHTLTDWPAFTAALAGIRQSGYAMDREEIIQGISCVAAPVLDAAGKVIAAVSTSMLQHAFTAKQEAAVREVQRLARKLSLC
ncbi:IclR family transcriptional regulator [Paenibacillus tritici]|uniref:IclR family transcriptional regulator n=1 Tax=Paenibacillus tritici TaxID=1873425 RepID=A0ABX2DKG8_9BACL|nr:IclR family transcriptional regulator [Paenibacillus tritici]